MKLTKGEALEALRDVSENHGTMWRSDGLIQTKERWDDLKRRGWVEFNPWAQRYLPTERGRQALMET